MRNRPTDDSLSFSYEDLIAYADRWRTQTLTPTDKELLSQGVSGVAYKQCIDGKEYLIPLPKNIRLLSVSPELAKRITRLNTF